MVFDIKNLVDPRVRKEIERMWDLMAAESSRIARASGAEPPRAPRVPGQPRRAKPRLVTRPGYREIHLRLSLVLSEQTEMRLEEADHVAFRDWGEDIVAFGGDNGLDLNDIWLEDVKDKLRQAVGRTGCTIKQLCDKYDTDGSGDLDFSEFVQIIRVDCGLTEKNLPEDEVQQLFETVDE